MYLSIMQQHKDELSEEAGHIVGKHEGCINAKSYFDASESSFVERSQNILELHRFVFEEYSCDNAENKPAGKFKILVNERFIILSLTV